MKTGEEKDLKIKKDFVVQKLFEGQKYDTVEDIMRKVLADIVRCGRK